MDTDDTPEDLNLGEKVEAFTGGQKLLNRYKLERVLGHGGMGVVWLARDEELDRDVAMKFLPAIVVNDRAGLNELKRETRRSLELTHPNIVRTYDFVQDNSIAGISMEYVDCDTLRNRRLDQPMSVFEPAVLGPWVRQLCSALDYAHIEAAIVHRDLKPANLMINGRDQLKVADFGISRSLVDSVSQISMRRGISGTLVYMSPQQLEGDSPTPLDDVYAVGATLYELITSRAPFFSGDIAGQVRDKTPASLHDRRESFGIKAGEIPENWEATIASCLGKEPSERPRSAGEIAVRLGLCAAADITMPTQDKPSVDATGPALPAGASSSPLLLSPVPRMWPRGKQKMFVGLAAAAALALLAWLAVASLMRERPTKNASSPAAALPLARGSVIIKTEPPGATVKVGDALPQTAPAVFPELKPGTYPVQIMRDGYEPKTVMAEVKPNQAADPGTITLVRSKGSLKIATKPEGLAYELRSEADPFHPLTGIAPLNSTEFETGNYRIKVTRAGWPPQEQNFTVARSELREALFDLTGGDVIINSVPVGAKVLHNKEELGVTPLPLKDQPPGEVNYTLTLAGYENALVQGSVQPGQPLTLEGTLKKTPKVARTSPRRQNTGARDHSARTNPAEEERNERIKRAFIPYYDIFKPR
ncbi:MAG TPA: serine/threonine-protein kinase [Chthoniobacterales bacterium]|nr:serine/threonine-protein kinase [Chthoniobacterales bacterium]